MVYVLLYYKFQEIKDPDYFARKHRSFCKKLGIFGKVLIAKEGINGSVSGTKEQVEKYKEFVHSLQGFSDVLFKEEFAFNHPFTKMIVRIRSEIVSFKKKIDINKKGNYLSPKELLELYKKDKIDNNYFNKNTEINKEGSKINNDNNRNNNVIILDARNYYEYNLGRFKHAINPNIKTFREFPKFVEKFKENFKKDDLKNKKIVMYCTGGIRCEKASAFMKEQGFENVYQLDGGIINFCQKFPNTVWEGKCFVFDKRLMSDLNQNNPAITKCIICDKASDLYRNCKNVDCDRLVIMCVKCQEKMHGCCSEKCFRDFDKYAKERSEKKKNGVWKAPKLIQKYKI